MRRILSMLLFLASCQNLLAQYTLNGNATQDACNAYSLTQAAGNQSGSVWNNNKINLTQSFDFNFDINLGSNDAGADGIAFVLQPLSTSVGSSGGGLGYNGITPAVGVTIDTWQNGNDNDPAYDHIAIQLNGDLNHNTANNIAGPVTAINGNNNIEDGIWHSLRIQWDVATTTLSIYVDGSLRISAVRDLVNTVFSGSPLVFWGFTGSTGGANNHQQFRTALNPSFHFGPAQKRCIGESIQFFDSSVSFTNIAKFYWDFGDGSPLDSVNLNPIHTYVTANDFIVKQRVIGADGCEATNTQTVRIGSKPIAGFKTDDNCVDNPIHFTDTSTAAVGTINNWYWDFGDATISVVQNPTKNYLTGGNKDVKLVVKTLEGCESDTLPKLIHIYNKPIANFNFTDSVCLGSPTFFFDNSVPAGDPINKWAWTFSDSTGVVGTPNAAHYFSSPGHHTAILGVSANGTTGCLGIITKDVFVVNKPTANFKYNTICQSAVATFTDSSYAPDGVPVNQWWWNVNGGITSTQNTITTTYINAGSDTVKLVVRNVKGCVSDTLKKPVIINPKPVANFGYNTPVCYGLPVQFSDSSIITGSVINKWSWVLNNAEWSTQQNASRSFSVFNPKIGLVATSALGCKSDTAFKTLFVNPVPDVTMNFKNSCKNAPVNFTATDNSGTVTQWKWVFGDGAVATTQNTQHTYTANGTYKVKLFATAATGCYSDSLQKDITIYGTKAFAGNDTIAAAGQPVQLHATGGLSYSWTPAIGLSDVNISNPVAIISSTQTYFLKAFTPEGCESYDDVTVKIYKGPDIYLPNAFTPNGDTKNDLFKGIAVGIKQFNYLKVYNRWGQLVFYTTDYNKGWDGMWKGRQQPGGVYIILANGIDFKGNIIDKKATVMLIR